jgi:hypothetical protein
MEHEDELLTRAGRVKGVDPAWLGASEAGAAGPDERAQRLREAYLLAGCLWDASIVVVDHLFEDVVQLRTAAEQDWPDVVDDSWVLSSLPERFRRHYTPVFAQKFLVAMVSVTHRLTAGWTPLACVAEELATRCLLDEVVVQKETFAVPLAPHWRSGLEEYVFEDLDHEFLYDDALDGFENDPGSGPLPGMPPMGITSWFVPFDDQRHMPPYAQDSDGPRDPDQEAGRS